MKFQAILVSLCAVLLSLGLALSATAGSIDDNDSDLIPDVFDNCSVVANGPGGGSCDAQQDTDGDLFGNICDQDLDGDGTVLGSDFTIFLGQFSATNTASDFDCDGTTLGSDFTLFLGAFGSNPGPGDTAL